MSTERYIFVSRPTVIDEAFEAAYSGFHSFLFSEGFTPRRLGQSDYSRKAPLQAVIDIIDLCCGAVVLGYPQMQLHHEVRRNSKIQNSVDYVFPTPWNQIEGALAYRARSPVLILAHAGVSGGVFDHGVTGEGVLHVDLGLPEWFRQPMFTQPYQEWKADVEACSQKQSSVP